MREILFRGKRVDGGGWVEGSLLCMNDKYYIYEHDHGDLEDLDFGMAWDEVSKETVGQYSGLKDKNGKMIFEGDKVTARSSNTGEEIAGNIVFDSGEYLVSQDDDYFPLCSIAICERFEITGNIHGTDNSEDAQ